ncbi:MAG1360 family OppF-related protein [Mycoplasma sp. CSL7503-lung]|uniref:MAG1360 family OppF-related protein n=1 Tax=Mycoplasma sp. CSL7503-lung TaxID=536372 RepID=UPI0021D120CD|nr:hypothetical protein [Mycoplasma sp. CSL7503-lung]MCU4706641.1 hypothetical protein [Mycoplasma sp. CSL7503-lung]
MNNTKNIFSIFNLFEKNNKKSFFSNKKKISLVNPIDIEQLNVQSMKTFFYISNNNKSITFDNIWNSIKYNRNTQISLRVNKKDGDVEILNDKKEILNSIFIFNTVDISDEKDYNLPLVEMWNTCFKDVNTYYKKQKTSKIFDNISHHNTKNLFSKTLLLHFEKIIDINQRSERAFKKLYKKFSNTIEEINIDLFQEMLNLFEKNIKDYSLRIFAQYIDLFKELKENDNFLNKNYKDLNEVKEEEKIIELKNRLKALNKIRKSSIDNITNQYRIDRISKEIKIINKLISKTRINSKSYIFNVIKKYKNKNRNLSYKINILSKKPNSSVVELFNMITFNKKIIYFWEKYKDKLLFLNLEELETLDKHLNNEFHLILMSNKNKNIINIYRDYIPYANIDNFIFKSKENKNNLNKTLENLNKELNLEKNKIYTQFTDYKDDIKFHEIKQKINMSIAETNWVKKSSNNLFNKTIKVKQNKFKRFKRSYKVLNDIIEKCYLLIQENHCNSSFLNELKNRLKNIDEILQKFIKKSEFYNLIIEISQFTNSKNFITKKAEIYYRTMLIFIKTYESISINIQQFLEPFNNLKIIERTKFKLIPFWLSKNKLIFVNDTFNIMNFSDKNELLRILSILCDNINTPFIFVSNDSQLIQTGTFDEIHIFNDYKNVEGFKFPEGLIEPKSLFTRKILKGEDIGNKVYEINFDDKIFKINSETNHYVYVSSEEYKSIINKQKEKENQNLDSTITKTSEHNLSNTNSMFYNLEFEIPILEYLNYTKSIHLSTKEKQEKINEYLEWEKNNYSLPIEKEDF